MNRRILGALALSAAVLCGCEAEDERTDNHGYGYTYDLITPAGIRYRNDGAARPADAALIDRAYAQAAECVGAWTDAADAELLAVSVPVVPGGYLGRFYSPALVLVGDAEPSTEQQWLYAHEFIHFLLYQLTADTDAAHAHPCFRRY